MAAKLQQQDMYESEIGDATPNNNTTPSQNYNNDGNLAWWKSNPQPGLPSASSSVYSTYSEKGLALEQVLSSPMTSVCVAASNRPFPGLEEEIVTQTTESVVSTASVYSNNIQHETPSPHPGQDQQQTQHKQEINSERWSQYSSASASSSLRKTFKPPNPLKWLQRRSESRSSAQYQQLEQDTTHSIVEPKTTNLSDEIIRDFGTDLVEKMHILEAKVDALSRSPVFTPQPRRREEEWVDVGIQVDLGDCNQEAHNDEDRSYQNMLEEKITHLTNTNTNLSSLNDLLSSNLYKTQNAVYDLQDEICLLREEKLSLERQQGSYDEQKAQIELQMDLIRRLGVLLGRREEHLGSERRMMKSYRDRINGLEDEVEMLRSEWERVLSLVMPRDKGPVLTTIEIDKDK